MEIVEKEPIEIIAEIKNIIDNFDRSLTFEEIILHGRLQRFVRANEYLYLKTQISALVNAKLSEMSAEGQINEQK